MRKVFQSTRWVSTLCGCLVVTAIVFGAFALFTETSAAGRCICPHIYAPVTCDNGKTYPNQCVANCRNAKNCVPGILF